jgi:Holliday junction resolvase RusA-like endonuclease
LNRLEFFVEGDPVPQGSVKAFKAKSGAVITTNDASGRLGRWRGDIRSVARPLRPGGECLEGSIAVAVDFLFTRPKSHFLPVTRSRPEPVLRPDAPIWHTQKPDVDRLLRAVLDSLTAVLYRDDSQVVICHVTKRVRSSALCRCLPVRPFRGRGYRDGPAAERGAVRDPAVVASTRPDRHPGVSPVGHPRQSPRTPGSFATRSCDDREPRRSDVCGAAGAHSYRSGDDPPPSHRRPTVAPRVTARGRRSADLIRRRDGARRVVTAGRERSAGRASLSVAARDRVSPRAGGRADGSDRAFTPTYPGVDNRPRVAIAERDVTPDERRRFEDDLVQLLADLLERQRTIAA